MDLSPLGDRAPGFLGGIGAWEGVGSLQQNKKRHSGLLSVDGGCLDWLDMELGREMYPRIVLGEGRGNSRVLQKIPQKLGENAFLEAWLLLSMPLPSLAGHAPPTGYDPILG